MTADWGLVLTAMVTPFDREGQIDEPAVARLVDYLLANGSDGLVVTGTTGESPTLTYAERIRMYELVKTAVHGRAPVIAGTGTNDTHAAMELTMAAEKVGVDGILLVTPYYNKPSQEGLYQHFRVVAESVSLPVMVYNVPGRTGCNLEAGTVIRLAHDVPNIVADKEASGNLIQASDIVAGTPSDFKLYSGEDGLALPLLSIGGSGIVSVTSHLVGRDMQALHKAWFAGDHREAQRLHAKMLPIVRACFQPSIPSPAPVKMALNLLGVKVGAPRLPAGGRGAGPRPSSGRACRRG